MIRLRANEFERSQASVTFNPKKLLNTYHIILFLIIILALFIRLYNLDHIPKGLFSDEAATGYDAYSILKTGRDAHGKFLPLAINRFDLAIDTAVMYTYLSVIPIYLFGLSTLSVRLVAAIVGSLTIVSTYLLAKELFNKKIALISALLVSVSPHHLIFSRWAHEGILVPFFVTLGVFFALKALKNPLFSIASSIMLGLSLYTYPIMKVFVPFIILGIFAFYRKEIFRLLKSKNRQIVKLLIISIIFFLLLAAFPYYNDLSIGGNKRFSSISIFNTSNAVGQFFSNMLDHLSPNFLFFQGDVNLRHNMPGFGQILPVLLPFILLGLGFAAYNRERNILLLIFLFVTSLIPASLTRQNIPHALRTISMIPFLEIIAAYGIFMIYNHFGKKWNYITIAATVILGLSIAANIGFFLYSYFIRYPAISEYWFQYGLKDAVEYAETHAGNYDRVILSRGIDYVFPLFFTRRNPSEFQRTGRIGKYFVCREDIEDCSRMKGRNLFIVLPHELPDKKIKETIFYSSGDAALEIVE